MDSKIVYKLPVEGEGYKTYNPHGEGENPYLWGEKATITMLIRISKEWNKKYPDHPLFIGDINKAGGIQTPGHPNGTHKDGLNFDIKFMSIDGKIQGGVFNITMNLK